MLSLTGVGHRDFRCVRSSMVGLARAQNASSSGVIFMGCEFFSNAAPLSSMYSHISF
jgi:hypothetical protein